MLNEEWPHSSARSKLKSKLSLKKENLNKTGDYPRKLRKTCFLI